MRIFFIGCVEFSFHSLQQLVRMDSNIVGVATKSISKFNSDHLDLSPFCLENGIPCKSVEDINSEKTIEWIKQLAPDVICVFGWSYLLKAEILGVPKMGVIGFHPTLLPRNRGRHPLIWALVLGLKQTGTTFFKMDEGADSGNILSQKVISIED